YDRKSSYRSRDFRGLARAGRWRPGQDAAKWKSGRPDRRASPWIVIPSVQRSCALNKNYNQRNQKAIKDKIIFLISTASRARKMRRAAPACRYGPSHGQRPEVPPTKPLSLTLKLQR